MSDVLVKDRILVVEDDVQLCRMLSRILENGGYAVRTVSCGSAALQDVEREPPDLVILDVKLPDIDGYKVCQHLREAYRGAGPKILMLTAMNQPVDQLRGFAHGADAYLVKPCEPMELLRTVGVLLDAPGSGNR